MKEVSKIEASGPALRGEGYHDDLVTYAKQRFNLVALKRRSAPSAEAVLLAVARGGGGGFD